MSEFVSLFEWEDELEADVCLEIGDRCVYIDVYPKITQKVIDRVEELTSGRVVYSAKDRRFVGRIASYNELALGINDDVMGKAVELAQLLIRERGGRVDGDAVTVTVDLDEKLDEDLRYTVHEYYHRNLLALSDLARELFTISNDDVYKLITDSIKELVTQLDQVEPELELMKRLWHLLEHDRQSYIMKLEEENKRLKEDNERLAKLAGGSRLEYVKKLEEKVKDLEERNKELRAENKMLKEKIENLRLKIIARITDQGIAVYGNTYTYRDRLRRMGFTWDPETGEWKMKIRSIDVKAIKGLREIGAEIAVHDKLLEKLFENNG